MSFGLVEKQHLKCAEPKRVTRIFVKNKPTIYRQEGVRTYKTAVSHFCKNNDLLYSAQNHENSFYFSPKGEFFLKFHCDLLPHIC